MQALLGALVGILVGLGIVQVENSLEREIRGIVRQLIRIGRMAPREATAAGNTDLVRSCGPVASCRPRPHVSAERELVGRTRDRLAVLIDQLDDHRTELVG
jgi:hypothetical protein